MHGFSGIKFTHFSRTHRKQHVSFSLSKSGQNILVCCWFSSLFREVFPRYSSYPLSSKSNILKNSNSIRKVSPISALSYYYCYCAYVTCISCYSGFPCVVDIFAWFKSIRGKQILASAFVIQKGNWG